MAQLITHHTVNGCNLQPGDMLGTGTLSGPLPAEAGSLLELTQGGKTPIELPWGESAPSCRTATRSSCAPNA